MIARLKFYNCHVRHAGNMLHTIPRQSVSAKELVLLRAIHGDDALDRVSPVREAKVDLDEHHMQLARTYGRARVEQALGVSLANFDFWLQGKIEDELGQRESRAETAEIAAIAASDDPFDDLEPEGEGGEDVEAMAEETTDPQPAPAQRGKRGATEAAAV
jgi:hypothetical protein